MGTGEGGASGMYNLALQLFSEPVKISATTLFRSVRLTTYIEPALRKFALISGLALLWLFTVLAAAARRASFSRRSPH